MRNLIKDSCRTEEKYTLLDNQTSHQSPCKACCSTYFSGKFWRPFVSMVLNCIFFLMETVFLSITLVFIILHDVHISFTNFWVMFIGIMCFWVSNCSSRRNTYGLVRVELLGALINSVLLIALSMSLAFHSANHIVGQPQIRDCDMMFVLGGVHLFIDVVSLLLLRCYNYKSAVSGHCDEGEEVGSDEMISMSVVSADTDALLVGEDGDTATSAHTQGKQRDLNMYAVYLQTVRACLTSVSTLTCALAIKYVEAEWRFYVDSVINIVASTFICLPALQLLLEVTATLVQCAPPGTSASYLQQKLLSTVKGVLGVHNLHVWQLTGSKLIASVHIVCSNPLDYMRIAEEVKVFFHDEGIHSVTIQPEFVKSGFEDNIGIDYGSSTQLDCGDSWSSSYNGHLSKSPVAYSNQGYHSNVEDCSQTGAAVDLTSLLSSVI